MPNRDVLLIAYLTVVAVGALGVGMLIGHDVGQQRCIESQLSAPSQYPPPNVSQGAVTLREVSP